MRTFLFLLFAVAPQAAEPEYVSKAVMKIPQGYRDWVFVGSNLGIGYSEGKPTDAKQFKNIYITPDAFRAYKATGKFPDKTMLVMEIYEEATKAEPAKTGSFEGKYVGIEVAVKDRRAVDEVWAYYTFFSNGKPLAQAKAFPKAACHDCHAKHGSVDNTFVQFYPRLRDRD